MEGNVGGPTGVSAKKGWQALMTPQPGTLGWVNWELFLSATRQFPVLLSLFSALFPTKKVTIDVLRSGGLCQMAPESGGGYQVGYIPPASSLKYSE